MGRISIRRAIDGVIFAHKLIDAFGPDDNASPLTNPLARGMLRREVHHMAQAVASSIDSLLGGVDAAIKAADTSALCELFTDDAVLMPPGPPDVTGADGVKSIYQPMFDQFYCVQNTSANESDSFGESGFVRGTFTARLTPKAGGEPVEVTGKWLGICRIRQDGSWKFARLIWNEPIPAIEAKP